MLSPTHYRTVVWVTIALVTIWYTLVAAFGYYLYGDAVHDNVSLDIRLGKWFVSFLNILICLTVGTKFALAAFPIVECFEDILDSEYMRSSFTGGSTSPLAELSECGDTITTNSSSMQVKLKVCVRALKQFMKRMKKFASRVFCSV